MELVSSSIESICVQLESAQPLIHLQRSVIELESSLIEINTPKI